MTLIPINKFSKRIHKSVWILELRLSNCQYLLLCSIFRDMTWLVASVAYFTAFIVKSFDWIGSGGHVFVFVVAKFCLLGFTLINLYINQQELLSEPTVDPQSPRILLLHSMLHSKDWLMPLRQVPSISCINLSASTTLTNSINANFLLFLTVTGFEMLTVLEPYD